MAGTQQRLADPAHEWMSKGQMNKSLFAHLSKFTESSQRTAQGLTLQGCDQKMDPVSSCPMMTQVRGSARWQGSQPGGLQCKSAHRPPVLAAEPGRAPEANRSRMEEQMRTRTTATSAPAHQELRAPPPHTMGTLPDKAGREMGTPGSPS